MRTVADELRRAVAAALPVLGALDDAACARARRPYARHDLDRIARRAVPADTPATIAGLAADCVGHLRHHLAALDASAAGGG
jgi:hypothetical protein